jgi:hypothetical protein
MVLVLLVAILWLAGLGWVTWQSSQTMPYLLERQRVAELNFIRSVLELQSFPINGSICIGYLACKKYSIISAAITDWEIVNAWNTEAVNQYITRHESTLLTFGLFMRGLRVSPVSTDLLHRDYYRTLDGVRGIITMNIAILRIKLG